MSPRLLGVPHRFPIRFPLLSAGLLWLLAGVPAATGADRWTVDDLIRAERLTGFTASPADPRIVVWERAQADDEKNAIVTHLFRRNLGDATEDGIQLTRGPNSCHEPKFSPDGRVLAFLSARPLPPRKGGEGKRDSEAAEDEPKVQIWAMNGGEPYPVTRWERDVRAFEWRDPRRLVFIAQEAPTRREQEQKSSKDQSRVVEDETLEPPVRLFQVDLETQSITRINTHSNWVTSVSVSPDGNLALTYHDRSLRFEYDNAERPAYFITDLPTGITRRIFTDRRFVLGPVSWSPDSSGFYVANRFTTDARYLNATVTELWRWDRQGAAEHQVPLNWTRGLASEASWYAPEGCLSATSDGVVALLADGARVKAARYLRTGNSWNREFLSGPLSDRMFAVKATERNDLRHLLFLAMSGTEPPQLHTARLNGNQIEDSTPVTRLNPSWKEKPRARPEIRRWKGALGEDVEGILWFPPDHRPGERRPLVVMIHGGPHGADMDAWTDRPYTPIQLHAQRGAFVLQVNYHGSSNYGLDFAESIAGGDRYYNLPVADIERGVDAVIDEGWVDPAKIGVMGWSNGAILTLALITHHPERYQAASSGAGGFEWVADTSITAFGQSFNDYYFGAMPWQDPQAYLRNAPYYQADRIRTPLIIFHGDADTAVPIHHGWMQFRALQQRTQTPVRFVLFPGEPHGLKKTSHLRRKVEEELAWFDRHLYRTETLSQPWLKEGSPLATLMAGRRARQDAGRFGMLHQGRLIPETIDHKGLHLGRFEVTRAQFAEFDPGYAPRPGQENFPASGISFDQARRYAEWLSGLTGDRWRLPNSAEAKLLYQGADEHGNSLDRWAGYAPNPEDASRLRAMAAEWAPDALLLPVGSMNSAGENPIFDLQGNVAEWTVGPQDVPELNGGSADLPADPVSRAAEPGTGYRGFRLVRE